MSTTIDSKVVEMRFDNKNFESNAATTISTLSRLKQALHLPDASKGLNDVASSAGRVNGPMAGISSAVETVRAKFSALQVMGVTALANITNSAVNAGKRIVSALTIEPIKMGFQEYETQMGAVQTIMANTSSKGTTLKQVNAALDELNTYADKTIYNFTEMTRNIGTFTAAGVDLDTSVSSIKGIANLAAVSGSTSQQASTAMYQLSQALAAGSVKLQDWNSVVNAGMGGQVFQDALKRTAKNMGTDVDALIKKYGSFRESLSKGEWLTTDVLTKTLEQFTMAAKEGSKEWENYKKSLMKEGYSEKQAIEILKMANTATDAATKVKTLTQLWDTLKEAAQSGWAQSWKIIVGDFEEAKALFTEISDTLGKIIGDSAESRNKVLQGWKDMGGRKDLIDSLKNAFEGVMSMVKPIGEAFREIFPPITAKTLFNLTQNLKKFTEGLKLSGETSDKVKRIFKGLFSIVDIVRKVITTATKALFGLSQSEGIGSLADFLLDTAAKIGDFFTSINKNFDTNGLQGIFSTVGSGISNVLKSIIGGLSGVGDVLASAGQWIAKTAKKIFNVLKDTFGWISEHVSLGDVFAGLAGGGIFVAAKKLSGVFDTIKDAIDKLFGSDGNALQSIKDTFNDVLGSVKDTLQSFTSGIKVWSLVGVAVAVGILAHSLRTISELNVPDIGKSLVAIGLMLTMLTTGFKSMTKSLSKFESGGIVKSAFALILVAKAVDILADTLVKVSGLSFGEIVKGLAAIGGALTELAISLKIIGKTNVSMSNAVTLVALAYSCRILGDALKKFGNMSFDEIKRGLTAMGGALGELVIALRVLKKAGGMGSIFSSAGIFIVVLSLDKLATALKKFGDMSWNEIKRGLTAMGGALGELGIVLGAVGKIAGVGSIYAGAAILITVQGLGDLADALKKFGNLSWNEIKVGLTAMGGALLELGIVLGAVGKIAGISSIFAAGAIWITVQGLGDLADALKKFGAMSWPEIGRGLVAMGGALLEVGGITGALGYLTNVAGILGAATIWVAVQGLGDLADALKKFGEMSWDEIKRGLAAMGGALGEVALGGLLNTLSIIGAFSINVIAESLGTLADSVKKWKDVSVPENLGEQLGQLAKGIFKFTFDGSGANAIATVAAPLGVMADSVKKWAGVTVPEGLGTQLGLLADGVSKFTFSGLGASAIADVGEPLGQLADSVKKWSDITVPENLSENLTSLSDGVKSFSWAFMGGWSLSTIVQPLTDLPDAIKKWKDITVPATLKDDLTGLADGILAFSWAFMGGWSISAIIQPLTDLPNAISKWTNVKVPEGLTESLTSIAEGIKQFSLLDAAKLQMVDDNIVALTDALIKLSGTTLDSTTLKDSLTAIADGIGEFSLLDTAALQLVDDNILRLSNAFKNFASATFDSSKLVTFAEKINECSTELAGLSTSNIDTASSAVNKIVNIIKKVNSTNTGNVNSFVTAANSLNKIKISKISVDSDGLSSAVKAIKDTMSSMSKAISSSKDSIAKAMTAAMSGSVKPITNKKSDMTSAAKKLTDAISKTISGKKRSVTKAFETLVSGGATAITKKKSSFESAGKDLGSGLVIGIKAKYQAAYNAGFALGQKAVQGEKDGQKSNSPSKLTILAGKWLGQGLVIGMDRMGRSVYRSGYNLGETATESIRDTIANIANIITDDIDTQPTIKPVVDLSNVRAGAAAVSGMLSGTQSVGLLTNIGSINSTMNRRFQNSGNDDVVSAIRDLKKTINNMPGNTTTIGDITYDDGSNVSNAVRQLVRAAKVERRT